MTDGFVSRKRMSPGYPCSEMIEVPAACWRVKAAPVAKPARCSVSIVPDQLFGSYQAVACPWPLDVFVH